MNRIYYLLFVLFIGSFTSCIPYKKINHFPYLEDLANGESSEVELTRSDYLLQPDDILEINITSPDPKSAKFFSQSFSADGNSNLPRMQGQSGGDLYYLTGYIVDDSGYVKIPVLGKIKAQGLSAQSLEDYISQELLRFFTKNSFYVRVKMGGIRFSVFGEISQPGRYIVLEKRYTIFQALSHAGGDNVFANRQKIILQRMEGDKQISFQIDLFDENIYQKPYYYIKPNDLIYVRQLKSKTFGVGAFFIQNLNSTLTILSLFITTYIAFNKN